MNRRNFLKNTAVSAVATSLSLNLMAQQPSTGKLKVLVLGGRDFFGPTLVKALITKGHHVTLFNRGYTNPDLFSDLPWIKGDREIADGSGLINLKNHLKKNTFDVVFDTWQKHPTAVSRAAKILKPYIGQYQYVSSISVYKDKLTKNIDENYPLYDLKDTSIDSKRLNYSQAKTWSEKALFEELGDKVVTFRSHGMRSNRLPNRMYEPYWPVRMLDGGDILLPQDKDHVMQVCDVVSMVDFMCHCAEKGHRGAFNMALPTKDFKDYINEAYKVTQKPHNKVWIPKDFLAKHDIEPYRDLPLWRPQLPGFYHINTSKAVNAGFKARSIQQMVTDQLSGYLSRNPNRDFMFGVRGTISRQKEKQVLNAWKLDRS